MWHWWISLNLVFTYHVVGYMFLKLTKQNISFGNSRKGGADTDHKFEDILVQMSTINDRLLALEETVENLTED